MGLRHFNAMTARLPTFFILEKTYLPKKTHNTKLMICKNKLLN